MAADNTIEAFINMERPMIHKKTEACLKLVVDEIRKLSRELEYSRSRELKFFKLNSRFTEEINLAQKDVLLKTGELCAALKELMDVAYSPPQRSPTPSEMSGWVILDDASLSSEEEHSDDFA